MEKNEQDSFTNRTNSIIKFYRPSINQLVSVPVLWKRISVQRVEDNVNLCSVIVLGMYGEA